MNTGMNNDNPLLGIIDLKIVQCSLKRSRVSGSVIFFVGKLSDLKIMETMKSWILSKGLIVSQSLGFTILYSILC